MPFRQLGTEETLPLFLFGPLRSDVIKYSVALKTETVSTPRLPATVFSYRAQATFLISWHDCWHGFCGVIMPVTSVSFAKTQENKYERVDYSSIAKPYGEDGQPGPLEWETRLPLAGMNVDEARGAANLLGRLQNAGTEGVSMLAGLGLVPDINAYRDQVLAAIPPVPSAGPVMPAQSDMPVYVNLSQMARIVRKAKNTLQNLIAKGEFPPCEVEGGGGKAALWIWDKARPWLMDRFGMFLPLRFREDAFPPRLPRPPRLPDDSDDGQDESPEAALPVKAPLPPIPPEFARALEEPHWEERRALCANSACPLPGRWAMKLDSRTKLCPTCWKNR